MIDASYMLHLNKIISTVNQCKEKLSFSIPVIAGGAIRDYLLDKPISDIDVFYDGNLLESKVDSLFMVTNGDYGVVYEENSFLVTHRQVYLRDEVPSQYAHIPIQLIKVVNKSKSVCSVIDAFPISLSRVYYTGNHITFPPNFLEDVSNKILHFNKGTSQKYIDKICKKYHDWWIVAEEPLPL